MTDKTLLQEARDALARLKPDCVCGPCQDAWGASDLLTRLGAELAKVAEPDIRPWVCKQCGEVFPFNAHETGEVSPYGKDHAHTVVCPDSDDEPEPCPCGPVSRQEESKPVVLDLSGLDTWDILEEDDGFKRDDLLAAIRDQLKYVEVRT